MNARLLSQIEAGFPSLHSLIANYRERREESSLMAIYRGVLAGDASRGFTRSDVLYMAACVARFDAIKRHQPMIVRPTADKSKRNGKTSKTSDQGK